MEANEWVGCHAFEGEYANKGSHGTMQSNVSWTPHQPMGPFGWNELGTRIVPHEKLGCFDPIGLTWHHEAIVISECLGCIETSERFESIGWYVANSFYELMTSTTPFVFTCFSVVHALIVPVETFAPNTPIKLFGFLWFKKFTVFVVYIKNYVLI